MKALFVSQSNSLRLFFDLYRDMHGAGKIEACGFYVSGSDFYRKFEHREALDQLPLLKEWEILERASQRSPDLDKLRVYEERYEDVTLWRALNADRRIYFGRDATFIQDYPARFGHDRMLAILQTAVEDIEDFFDRVQPDFVASFICVTLGEYLIYLVAKRRGVPVVNMRPTRLRNYFFGGETIFEPSLDLQSEYEKLLRDGLPEMQREDLEAYLEGVRGSHAMYEGVMPVSAVYRARIFAAIGGLIRSGFRFLAHIPALIREWYAYSFGEYRHDNSHVPRTRLSRFLLILKPYRRLAERRALNRHYAAVNKLPAGSFVFYPLHKEPEQTMQVYSRPFQNQIEVIRNLALNLPVSMRLVVKEHPVSVGYRPLTFYKKILAIPNVMMAAPETKSSALIEKAKLVAVISGSGALEAIMMRKPALHLGRVPFSMLPDSMISRAVDLFELGELMRRMMHEHSHDEEALLAYLAAVQNLSVSVDWYTRLLGRGEGFRFGNGKESAEESRAARAQQIRDLGDYILRRAGVNNVSV